MPAHERPRRLPPHELLASFPGDYETPGGLTLLIHFRHCIGMPEWLRR
jgi:hypothetical protein